MRFNFCVFCEKPKSDQTLVDRTEGLIHYHQKCLDKESDNRHYTSKSLKRLEGETK